MVTPAPYTVSRAAFVAADPPALVATARYCEPLRATPPVAPSVAVVTPLYVASFERFCQAAPLQRCHCHVGTGKPVAAAEKDVVPPGPIVRLAGCCVIVGATKPASAVYMPRPCVTATSRLFMKKS